MAHKRSPLAHQLFGQHYNKGNLIQVFQERVVETKAIGRDGTSTSKFESRLDQEIDIILRKVGAGTYDFTTYREKLVSKGPRKFPRIISIPTVRDRLTLRALNDILASVFPDARICRPHLYIKELKQCLKDKSDNVPLVRVDIENFYPSIDHRILLRKLRRKIRKQQILHLIENAVATPTGDEASVSAGVPQGLSISNILASIYLRDLDEQMKRRYAYFRYVDDVLIVGSVGNGQEIFADVRRAFKRLKLKCHPLVDGSKSRITSAAEGVEYLGYLLTNKRTSVRRSSFNRMIENLLAVFTAYRHRSENTRSEQALVWRLNLKITGCIYEAVRYGWVFFFSQIDDVQNWLVWMRWSLKNCGAEIWLTSGQKLSDLREHFTRSLGT